MKALTRFSDFPEMESIRRDMDRFFDDLVPFSWKEANGGKNMDLWAPNTDMSETEDEYLITVDLPGISKKDVEVNFQDNRLTISGERSTEEQEEKENYLRKERYTGRFLRTFTFPGAIKDEEIVAKFKDGVLTINVPKSEVSKPTKVSID